MNKNFEKKRSGLCFLLLFFISFSAHAFMANIAFWREGGDPCGGSPTPGTICSGGAIFAGTLGTDNYMTTPGGCGQIPAGQIVGSGQNAYPNGDFTPTCSGTDSLIKMWNDGSTNYYDIPGLTNYTTTTGTGNGLINTDANYGSTNTANIVAITAPAEGGYHAAASYCDKLIISGYSDWYLPNRYELNLLFTNRATIQGINTSGIWYLSSTEASASNIWTQNFSTGAQFDGTKNTGRYMRCVRRF